MEKRDYYNLKEIILGLHDAYQVHQSELLKLKSLCTMNEKKATDFSFRIYQPEAKNPTLLCQYEPKRNQIQKFLTYVSQKSGYYIYGRHTAHLVTDHNKYYFLCGNSEYPVHVNYDYGMEEQFFNQANLILASEFANHMRSKYIEKNISNTDAALSINTEAIQLYIRRGNSQYPSSLVWYNSSSDTLLCKSYEEDIDSDYIADVLSMEFPISELNPYHLKTLSSSKKTNSSIIIECTETANEIELGIEEGKTLVLSKKKK